MINCGKAIGERSPEEKDSEIFGYALRSIKELSERETSCLSQGRVKPDIISAPITQAYHWIRFCIACN